MFYIYESEAIVKIGVTFDPLKLRPTRRFSSGEQRVDMQFACAVPGGYSEKDSVTWYWHKQRAGAPDSYSVDWFTKAHAEFADWFEWLKSQKFVARSVGNIPALDQGRYVPDWLPVYWSNSVDRVDRVEERLARQRQVDEQYRKLYLAEHAADPWIKDRRKPVEAAE
jgi:hypothetical protein